MRRTVVLDVVGLTPAGIGPDTPHLRQFRRQGKLVRVQPMLPAVTCSVQATYLTGRWPAEHGIVGNGWYDRELAEVHFWKQSNHLVQAPKVWEGLRRTDPAITCAKLFWWFNMYASVDWSITPRPLYPADGRKVFDIYSQPLSIRDEIKRDLGEFPFPTFWGPAAGVDSPQGPPDAASRWIARAAQWIEERYQPTLSLVYLPHLDYNLQRFGPDHPTIHQDLQAIDRIAGELIEFFHARGLRILVLSEYGLRPVRRAVHLNRVFREKGWITIKMELGREMLDCGASRAFALADHQIAHIYLNDTDARWRRRVRACLEAQPGVAQVLGPEEKARAYLDHPRAGDLIAVADEDAWFTYYYWFEDALAPDFARTVDIHRKPGYDPVELFLDPTLKFPRLKIAWRLLQKRLGFRMLMDVIPLDPTLVKGSHGAPPADPRHYPVAIVDDASLWDQETVEPTRVAELIRRCVLE